MEKRNLAPSKKSDASLSLIHHPQFENFLQDFNLEILNDLRSHFWAFDQPLNSAGIVVNW